MRHLLLALLLAPAHAQPVKVRSFAATTPVHRTLLGSVADPKSPVSRRLSEVLSSPHGGGAEGGGGRYAVHADRLRTSDEPLDRAVSSLLEKAAESGELADAVFDGSVGTEALDFRKHKLWYQGVPVKPLGQGAFGIVYANPAVEGQVIKVTALSTDAALFAGATPQTAYAGDVAATRHLAEAGIGPRLIAEKPIGGVAAVVKERIYGVTVQSLIWDRAYTPEMHAHVVAMIRRMVAKRIRVGDMNPANIMIGRTLVDPTLRAYHVDGGHVEAVGAEETDESLFASIYHQAALFKKQNLRDIGMVESTVALSTMLEQGLRRAGETTFWQKLKGFLKEAYLGQ